MAAYFNRTLYLRTLKRFWPLTVAIFIVAFFTFVVPELGSRNYRAYELYGLYSSGPRAVDLMPQLMVYCAAFVPLFSIFTAVAVFGYLHKPKAAGFVSSLPISRLGLYITNWLSGLTIMLVPTLLIGALYGTLLIGMPVIQGHFFIWLGMMLFAHLIFFSIAVFATFLTGKVLMQVFLYGLMNFILLILYSIGTFVISRLVFGYAGGFDSAPDTIIMFLTPPVAIVSMIGTFSNSGMPDDLISILPWIIYPLLTTGLFFFGYKLYKRRRIELAGDVIIHKTLQVVFKYLMGLLLGAMLGFSLTEIINAGSRFSMLDYIICFTASIAGFGALGCLFAEMLIRKKLRVWKTAYKGMLIFAGAVIAIVLFIRFDLTGYERLVPNPNRVVAVSFSGTWSNNNMVLFNDEKDLTSYQARSGYGWRLKEHYVRQQTRFDQPLLSDEILREIKQRSPDFFESSEALALANSLHRSIINDKRSLENNSDLFYYGHGGNFILTYKMDNGRVITRQYRMSVSETPLLDSAEALYALYASSEAVNKRCRFVSLPNNAVTFMTVSATSGSSISIEGKVSDNDVPALLDAMRMDVAAGTLGIIDLETNTGYFLWNDKNKTFKETYRITMIYDHHIAGVPYEFEETCVKCGSSTCPDSGLFQVLTVTGKDVNTVNVLKALTLENVDDDFR